MRINNLKIDSFGKLSDVNIALDDRITVIAGKNEAGKSTVSNFVKYMLYGFDNTKKQSLSDNQKKKYMPWQSSECMGEMDFTTSDGKKYRACRRTEKRTNATIFDQNDMPVTSDNAGDYFFGVTEATYKKTAFIGSSDTSFSDDGELSMAIRNMVYNADETLDGQKALKKLEDVRKYYLGKAERSGQIFELEKELSHLSEERDKWKDGHKELLEAEYHLKQTSMRLSDNKEKLAELSEEKQNLVYKKAKQRLDSIAGAKNKMDEGKREFEEHFKLMQKDSFVPNNEYLSEIKKALSNIDEAKRRAEEAKTNLAKARDNLENVYSDKKQKDIFEKLSQKQRTREDVLLEVTEMMNARKKAKKIAVILTCLIITIPVAIFFYIKSLELSKNLSLIAAEYDCGSAEDLCKLLSAGANYVDVVNTAKQFVVDAENTLCEKNEIGEGLVSQLEELLRCADVDISNVDEYIIHLEAWLKKTDELKQICRDDFVSYSTLTQDVDLNELSALSQKYDENKEKHDEKTLMQKISFYTQAIDALAPKERELEKKAAVLSGTLPKPSEIQTKILTITENLYEMRRKHEAIVLAIETLEKASESMKSEAAPKIASQTSELFSSITEGKYKALYADSNMNLTFLKDGDAEVRDALYLSTGTMDAAYISLRIALCTFLYKENPTLVFDDAFSHMDEDRLKNTLDFLKELSKDFQIIILSCHDREKNYLKDFAKVIDFKI